MTLLFVPLDRAGLAAWAGSGRLGPVVGFAPTPAFRGAFGFGPGDDETADYTVLCVAGVSCLTLHPARLVAVAEADVPASDDEFGRVSLPSLPYSAVTALFAEGSAEMAERTHAAIAGVGLDEAWDDARVETLLAEGDLLWHGPTEWGTLV